MAGLLTPGPTRVAAEELRAKRGSRGLLEAVGTPLSYAPLAPVAALGQGLLGARYLTGEKEIGEGLASLSDMTAMMIGARLPPIVRNVVNPKVVKQLAGKTKVVDENGQPTVVYHKTNGHIDKFDPDRIGTNDYGYAGHGFYFMPEPLPGLTYGNTTMPVYLALKNPYVRTNENWKTDALNPYTWIPANQERLGGKAKAARAWTDMMKAKGYDGFIDRAGDGKGEIVAFDPGQIISAFSK